MRHKPVWEKAQERREKKRFSALHWSEMSKEGLFKKNKCFIWHFNINSTAKWTRSYVVLGRRLALGD